MKSKRGRLPENSRMLRKMKMYHLVLVRILSLQLKKRLRNSISLKWLPKIFGSLNLERTQIEAKEFKLPKTLTRLETLS